MARDLDEMEDFDDTEDFDEEESLFDLESSAGPPPPDFDHDAVTPGPGAYGTVLDVGSTHLSLPLSHVTVRGGVLRWRSKNGQELLCELPLSKIERVRVVFRPSVNDALFLTFFFGLTLAFWALLGESWARTALVIGCGALAVLMFIGVLVTRVLELHTRERVVRITVEDDATVAQAFAASLEARIEKPASGPFR